FKPGYSNREVWHPIPTTVLHTDEARAILVEARQEAEVEYTKAEAENDTVGTTVWGRVSEHIRKLSLIYAVSEDHARPQIGREAVDWARGFTFHLTRRMLFMTTVHVADNPFLAECQKFMQKLKDAPRRTLSHSSLLKRMKTDSRRFQDLVTTLLQRGDIVVEQASQVGHGGRPVLSYRLTNEAGGA
ncbi:MAG: hypothetical protein AB7F75_13070, partial [Planctomycetota bacterium]